MSDLKFVIFGRNLINDVIFEVRRCRTEEQALKIIERLEKIEPEDDTDCFEYDYKESEYWQN